MRRFGLKSDDEQEESPLSEVGVGEVAPLSAQHEIDTNFNQNRRAYAIAIRKSSTYVPELTLR